MEAYLDLYDAVSLSNSKLMGKSIAAIMNGTFQFEDLNLYGDAFETYNFRVYPQMMQRDAPFSDLSLKNELVLNKKYFYYFPIKIYECSYGQIIEQSIVDNLTYCSSCSAGTYSLNQNGFCSVCPFGADCSSGILVVNPGFWRINTQIFACTPKAFSCL